MSVLLYWSPTTLVAHASQGCSSLLPCRAPLTSSFGSAERKSCLTMMKDPPRTSTFPQVFFFAFLSCQSWASNITIGVKATLLKACFKVQQTNSEVRNEIWQKRNKSTSQFKPGRFFLLFCYPPVIIWFYWTISLPFPVRANNSCLLLLSSSSVQKPQDFRLMAMSRQED